MTDLFERRLAERLQAHPMPEEIPDLGIRSVRLGERIRRRRIGAAVLAVVLAAAALIVALTRSGSASTPTYTAAQKAEAKTQFAVMFNERFVNA